MILANNRCHETKPLPAFQPSGKKKQENRSDRNTMLLVLEEIHQASEVKQSI